MRRLLDIFISLLALTLLSPLLLITGILVRLLKGSPVFYRQWRLGKAGKPFVIYKFRTMEDRPENDLSVAPSNDPRITRFGLHLKRARLDELPQFFNILMGDMSLVGPRPLTAGHLDILPQTAANRLLQVRPGLTSAVSVEFLAEDDVLANVSAPETVYKRVLLPEKIRRELAYLERVSCWSDLKTVARTAQCLWSPKWRRASARLVTYLIDTAGPETSRPW